MARSQGGEFSRRPKRRRVQRTPVEPAPESTEEDRIPPRTAPIKSRVAGAERLDPNNTEGDDKTTEEIEKDLLAFCCHTCRCPPSKESMLPVGEIGKVHTYIQSCNEGLYHRCCCHGIVEGVDLSEWASLYDAAKEKIFSRKRKDGLDEKFRWVTSKEIQDSYNTARRQESALYNADGDTHPLDRLRTHADYTDGVDKPFKDLCEKVSSNETPRRRAVVLDAFAGVGTGIVVLKRLGIDIAKIVHVEHDKVATHVYRWNHDPSYNNLDLPDDDIDHVFVDEWETFEAGWETYCKDHGPFDIIVGGPPCADYSKVNANRQGTAGKQGQYMIRFGELIRKIERLQHPHPVFFLAENVFLSGHDRTEVMEAFGMDWDPIALDAQYLSPTRRNRHFVTNIPLSDVDFTKEISIEGPSSCLEEGFFVPAHLLDPEVTAKAQCLMASKSRIDEFQTLRMFVFRKQNDVTHKYHGRPMLIVEREKLMGYPVGYIEEPVRRLFEALGQNALNITMQDDQPWKERLPEMYHNFAGNYHALRCKNPYRFEVNKDDPPFIYAKMAPPDASKDPPFFNVDGYAKHLIGMAYSVPVVELLLEPLQQIFKIKEYKTFTYKYAWEPEMAVL